ncbi:MFS transporter, DHA2 family, multidrug resistance protein [Amycolatopsis arida]|uniref:MFS transporter, DHA2 family, multidrug resistance protein n=1 Tax=Amycolatopsis arida TaxID=587909 RepID=A0A1I5T4N0_9PSEU|nr:MFS transporter [Amycolatopsis arida]TDX96231.1 DHA2 family multidrug resistance protein-like MFS transporter [Amycolatopsis arida]SFP77990.1 MFS transporter, DHA2 family, multidrug resistance protein [Amycolatopsis arida]
MVASAHRRWVALAVLVLPVLLISVDMTVLGFALPYLAADLAPTSAQQLWIVDIYSFLLAGLLVLMGTLGDRIGRRRLLLAGAAAFGAASALAAWAPSAELLIVARALLGIGGATLMPSTLALIRGVFLDPRERRVAIAVWSAGFAGGMALGPVLGGWLLEHFWWGSVFLINVPVMVLLLVLGPALLPEARDPRPGRFDPLSALLALATMLPLVYGLKKVAADGLTATAVVAVVAGLVLGWVFVHRQRTLAEPMLDLGLFGHRAFSVSVVTNVLGVFALAGVMFLVPQYLQLVLGLRPMVAGLWMLPATVAGVAGALLAARLARRFPSSRIIAIGLLLAAAGYAALTQLGVHSGLAVLTVSFVLIGGGIALAETLTNDLIISVAPPARAGAASAISETGYELGGALGIAVLGSAATWVYRTGLGTPGGVPAEAVGAARETMAGAVAAAHELPGPLAEALLAPAGAAFVHGLRITAVFGAVILLYAGVQAALLLRPARMARVPA